MNKDCLKHCPNIKWGEIGVNVSGGALAFLPGMEASMRKTASKILDEAKKLTETCPGPIAVPTVVTTGIIHRNLVNKIIFQCPQIRREI